MAKDPCERFLPHLSAFADDTLPPRRWEQICYHLAGCDSCRREVDDIAAVCSKLSSFDRSHPPASLTARLESIAGEHASAPLYMAPGEGELPSRRRKRARRATQGGVGFLAVMVSAMVLAVFVAPNPATIADPVKAARELYSQSLTAISVSEAVGAMLLANERGADFGASETYEARPSGAASSPITAQQAAELLRRSTEADLTITGFQQVWASDGEGYYRTAQVRTTKVPGEGTNLEVFDAGGTLFSSTFLPEFNARSFTAPPEWIYERGTTVEQVIGRDAFLVQANSGEQLAARWWIDARTGLLLWAERYDALGGVRLAYGYRELSLDAGSLNVTPSAQVISLSPASSEREAGWCVGFDHCPQSVAGLPLVAHATSGTSMNLVYSDGFTTAVVGRTEGVLEHGVLNHTARRADMTVEVWQAGEAVLSVACDCSPGLMLEIRDDLPAQHSFERTIAVKIRAGLGRLTGMG